eukprot:CAMPEP_0196580862 /NCGR_PEP_ID=MMETSP1081-20130531/31081_1 /TAXON_ID=36882 /ORGANISM="Pyramimonas amylifera, Strain CCMP720" /LENGTH=277 /DNA_ID=CAMNT_0041900875 /DNA_START=139 /DNA_END=972 /DNA_ORIENTATION=-
MKMLLPVFVCFFLMGTVLSSRDFMLPVKKSAEIKSDNFTHAKNEQWDFFLFVQSWDPELCASYSGREHNCVASAMGWTIHGLWPNREDGSYPSYCKSKIPFKFSKLARVEEELNMYWTNCFKDTEEDHLWEHEYLKHGTCALQAEGISDELDYFTVGLKLRRDHDVNLVLSSHGILPSADMDISVSAVNSAYLDHTGVKPWLTCSHASGGRQWLSQVGMCLTKDTREPIECPSNMYHSESCKENEKMGYIVRDSNSLPKKSKGVIRNAFSGLHDFIF